MPIIRSVGLHRVYTQAIQMTFSLSILAVVLIGFETGILECSGCADEGKPGGNLTVQLIPSDKYPIHQQRNVWLTDIDRITDYDGRTIRKEHYPQLFLPTKGAKEDQPAELFLVVGSSSTIRFYDVLAMVETLKAACPKNQKAILYVAYTPTSVTKPK